MVLRACSFFLPALLFLSACAHNIDYPIAERVPFRTLRTLIIRDSNVAPEKVQRLIAESNTFLVKQTGIILDPVFEEVVVFPSHEGSDVLNYLYHLSFDRQNEFDLCIGFLGQEGEDRWRRALFGDWVGVIDETYRRYVVIKQLDKRALVQQVYLAFIPDQTLSQCGVMSNLFELLPGLPLDYSMRLCEEDRTKVLTNKNRPFGCILERESGGLRQ